LENISIQDNLGKRRNSHEDHSNIQGAEPIKKIHLAKNSKNNSTLTYSQNFTKLEEHEPFKPLNFETKEKTKDVFCTKTTQQKSISPNNSKKLSQRNPTKKVEKKADKEHFLEYLNKEPPGEIKEEHILKDKSPFNMSLTKFLNKDNLEIDSVFVNKLSNSESKNIRTTNPLTDSSLGLLEHDQRQLENNDKNKLKEDFQKTISNLSEIDCPFGRPIFEIYQNLSFPSKWEKEDPTGWYLSEKLDGIRCVWSGFEMYSINGTLYDIPDYFLENLPKSPLDGALYGEKGRLSQCKAIVQKRCTDPEWNDLNFVIYDAPELKIPFQDRLKKLKDYFWNKPYVKVHDYIICKGMSHANQEFSKIKDSQGEGIILTHPQYIYKKGKNNLLLEKQTTQRSVTEILDEFKEANVH